MICEDVRAALGAGDRCEETEEGARVLTHCLYPSFEAVAVFITKLGDGYRVSDGGGAVRNAWLHGRDEPLSHRMLSREASRYHLKVSGYSLVAEVPTIEWLRSAILATANASASVAQAVNGKATAATERLLKEKIRETLSHIAPEERIGTDVEVTGNSGDLRHFDYSIKAANDNILVISALAPHHTSIAAKYVAFADTKGLNRLAGFAVYDRPLERGDISLLLQVTDLVPIGALDLRARKALAHGWPLHGATEL